MAVFPIKAGPDAHVSFASRFDEHHEGTDIFAPKGTPVVAVEAGRVRHAIEPRGGKAVYLITNAGEQFYYAHLDKFARPMKPTEQRIVRAGEVLGTVGNTGNAKGGPPHVHFEHKDSFGTKLDPFNRLVQLAESQKHISTPKPRGGFGSKSSGGAQGLGVLLLLWAVSKGLG